jgi:very-short-patch-repair endonuclease
MPKPIFYQLELTENARKLRKAATGSERRFWAALLKDRKLKGYKFTRQKPIQRYILDFYCAKLMLGVEIDGKVHERLRKYDAKRTAQIEALGIKIVRYSNDEIFADMEAVREDLERWVLVRERELE